MVDGPHTPDETPDFSEGAQLIHCGANMRKTRTNVQWDGPPGALPHATEYTTTYLVCDRCGKDAELVLKWKC